MQHLVIHHILEEPHWHERAIEQRMNADDAILFLDGAENEVLARRQPAATTPGDFVSLERVVEKPRIQAIENRLQIKVFSLRSKSELPLDRARARMRNFSFGSTRGHVGKTHPKRMRQNDRLASNPNKILARQKRTNTACFRHIFCPSRPPQALVVWTPKSTTCSGKLQECHYDKMVANRRVAATRSEVAKLSFLESLMWSVLTDLPAPAR
jgi:hypothetical protein